MQFGSMANSCEERTNCVCSNINCSVGFIDVCNLISFYVGGARTVRPATLELGRATVSKS